MSARLERAQARDMTPAEQAVIALDELGKIFAAKDSYDRATGKE